MEKSTKILTFRVPSVVGLNVALAGLGELFHLSEATAFPRHLHGTEEVRVLIGMYPGARDFIAGLRADHPSVFRIGVIPPLGLDDPETTRRLTAGEGLCLDALIELPRDTDKLRRLVSAAPSSTWFPRDPGSNGSAPAGAQAMGNPLGQWVVEPGDA